MTITDHRTTALQASAGLDGAATGGRDLSLPLPLSTDRATLSDLAGGLAAAEPLWGPHAHHGPDRRPVRLVATDTWEAWIIGWSGGHQVEMHDHGLSAGALAVIEGELMELVLDGRRIRSRRLRAGTVQPLAAGLVHDVLASARATSLHVYAPALTSMTYYDDDRRPAWTAMVEPEEPVVDLRSVSRALHPAARP